MSNSRLALTPKKNMASPNQAQSRQHVLQCAAADLKVFCTPSNGSCGGGLHRNWQVRHLKRMRHAVQMRSAYRAKEAGSIVA